MLIRSNHRKTLYTLLIVSTLLGITTSCRTTESQAISREITYTTVTEGFDWGPAITKIIINFGYDIDYRNIQKEHFKIYSIRRYRDMNMDTFSLEEEQTDHESERIITNFYPSDQYGNKVQIGSHVTLEMQVGPNLMNGSPFQYNLTNRFNEYVETSYKIFLKKPLKTSQGIMTPAKDPLSMRYAGDRQLLSEEFIHNQRFSFEGISLGYASFSPETLTEKGSVPLVIWLHGSGEGGEDTTIATLGNKVTNLITPEIQLLFGDNGAHILVPQNNTVWMDVDGTKTYNSSVPESNGESYYTKTLFALIESYIRDHSDIDRNRIYIGGCSNGGYMTVNMIIEYPDYFAAAYPICHGYSVNWMTEERIEKIKNIPIWLTHAVNDPVLSIAEGEMIGWTDYRLILDAEGKPIMKDDYSNALYDRLINAGAKNIHYSLFGSVIDTSKIYFKEDNITPYEYSGHFSWVYALNNDCVKVLDGEEITLFNWLSRQSK